jgi:hypothetical protein
MMVETMGRTDTPKESIENLLQVKQMYYPDQPIDWESVLTSLLTEFAMSTSRFINELLFQGDHLLDKFASPPYVSFPGPFQERMQFLVNCGMSDHVEALAFKVWRDHIADMIHTVNFQWNVDNIVVLRTSKLNLPILKTNTLS